MPYEEPYHVNLLIDASNGQQRAQLEFYDNAEALSKIARDLHAFPRHKDHVVIWELGSERPEDNFAYYFRFRVFALDTLGHCAVQLRFNNNRDLPDREIAEFCIRADPAQLDRLAKLLGQFSHLKHELFEWDLDQGLLSESRDVA
jgi:hypothetical protein